MRQAGVRRFTPGLRALSDPSRINRRCRRMDLDVKTPRTIAALEKLRKILLEATKQSLKRKSDMMLNKSDYILLTKDEILSLIALGEEISTATMQDIMNELSIKQ